MSKKNAHKKNAHKQQESVKSATGKFNARLAAFQALLDVERGAYANLALKESLAKENAENAPQRDKSLAAAIFYTALEHKLMLEFYIRHYAKKRVPLPVRCLLMLTMAQLLYMDVPAYAAIDECIKLMRSLGKIDSIPFANALLRNIERNASAKNLPQPTGDKLECLAIELSTPVWLLELLIQRFGESGAKEFLSSSGKQGICLRANTLKCSVEELDRLLENEGLEYTKGNIVEDARYVSGIGDLMKWNAFRDGLICVQGESSMLAAKACGVRPDMKVLDVCAAPGGKSAYLAAMMGANPPGELHSWDVSEHRVGLIQKNCERLGIDYINICCHDARQFNEDYKGYFDLVLIDAPCSGLGVINGKPDIKYAKTPEMLTELASLQHEILENCCEYVAKDGALVYSTCTVTSEENEDQIKNFLNEHDDFVLDDITFALPNGFDAGCAQARMIQLLPHTDGVDGFFIARLKRVK